MLKETKKGIKVWEKMRSVSLILQRKHFLVSEGKLEKNNNKLQKIMTTI